MLDITNHQGNANQNHYEIITSHLLEWLLSKKTKSDNKWWGWRQKVNFVQCARSVNWCSHYGKTVWKFVKKLMTELPHKLTIPFQGILTKEMKTLCQRNFCTLCPYPYLDAFELWCCRRFLWVPWTARRPNLSILKEINPKYSLEGLMLKAKLTHWKRPEKAGEGRRRQGWQKRRDSWMASPTQWIWVWANSEMVKDSETWGATGHQVAKSRTWLSDWTTTTTNVHSTIIYNCQNTEITYVHRPMNGQRRSGTYTQWNTTQS